MNVNNQWFACQALLLLCLTWPVDCHFHLSLLNSSSDYNIPIPLVCVACQKLKSEPKKLFLRIASIENRKTKSVSATNLVIIMIFHFTRYKINEFIDHVTTVWLENQPPLLWERKSWQLQALHSMSFWFLFIQGGSSEEQMKFEQLVFSNSLPVYYVHWLSELWDFSLALRVQCCSSQKSVFYIFIVSLDAFFYQLNQRFIGSLRDVIFSNSQPTG